MLNVNFRFYKHKTNFALENSNRVNKIGETSIFYALLPISPLDKILQWLLWTSFFSLWGLKKVVTGRVIGVVILYSNCIGIGGHLNRFDYILSLELRMFHHV